MGGGGGGGEGGGGSGANEKGVGEGLPDASDGARAAAKNAAVAFGGGLVRTVSGGGAGANGARGGAAGFGDAPAEGMAAKTSAAGGGPSAGRIRGPGEARAAPARLPRARADADPGPRALPAAALGTLPAPRENARPSGGRCWADLVGPAEGIPPPVVRPVSPSLPSLDEDEE